MLPLFFLLLAVPGSCQDAALSALRAGRADLNVRPERWDTRTTLPAVEGLLADPLALPTTSAAWFSDLKTSTSSAGLVLLTADTLGVHIDTAPLHWREDPFHPELNLPPELGRELRRLAEAVNAAKPLLDRAVASVPAQRRAVLISSLTSVLSNRDDSRLDAGLFDDAGRFDVQALAQALFYLARAADEAIPALSTASAAAVGRQRIKLPSGDLLLAGGGDDTFTPEDLEGTVLLVDLGGKSRYLGPVAAAGDGEIRMVIDLGGEVSVEAAASPRAAGSGVFGIGLLYLPNAGGVKVLQTGDVSLGAGFFGAGGLFARGAPQSSFAGRRFTQGAGAYGIGLFDVQADSSAVDAHFAGQGFGFTRGAGVFRLAGSSDKLECGLVDPDPREPLATLSFCQGTGLGVRAFAAGGVGLAQVRGDRSTLRSGYFAQGSGYWHAFGGLSVIGDGNHLKARRYDQGAGIHTALGALSVAGDHNRIVNWGVGPAYGWDYGSGSFSLAGDDNTVYAEWGTGHGDINGNAFAHVRGDRNLLQLPEFGSGAFRRNAPSYAIAVVEGDGNRLKFPLPAGEDARRAGEGTNVVQFNPWGVLISSGLILDPKLELPKPSWPSVEAADAVRDQAQVLERRIAEAASKPEAARLADWLSIGAAFSVASGPPREMLARLFSLPAGRAAELAALVSPDRFDEFLWLRAVFAGLGRSAATALEAEAVKAEGLRRAVLFGTLRYGGAAEAPALEQALRDSDWRVRREAAAALGWIFDKETGEEPGRLTFLDQALAAAGGGEEPFASAGVQRLPDAMAVLGLDPGARAEDKTALLATVPGPTDPLGKESYATLARILRSQGKRYRDAIRAEQGACRAAANPAREALQGLVADPDPAVAASAVSALGQIGAGQDAALAAQALGHPSALVREAAAAALGRMGEAGRSKLFELAASTSSRVRALAALGMAGSTELETLKGLSRLFGDPDPSVRLAAVSALSAVQSPLRGQRAMFAQDVRTLAEKEDAPSVRASAAWQLPQIER